MDYTQTISLKTMEEAKSIGYDNFPIIQKFLPTMKMIKTCRAVTLHDWIYTHHKLLVETTHDENKKWGYILWKLDKDDISPEAKLTYIDDARMFKSENDAFDNGLQRAIYEIKNKTK